MSRREKTEEKSRLDKAVEKALKYLEDSNNEDKLIKFSEVDVNGEKAVVAIGKCRGSRRAFPCLYIEYQGRGFTFSTSQVNALVKVLNALPDEVYAKLGVFVEESSAKRARPTRKVEEEGEEGEE